MLFLRRKTAAGGCLGASSFNPLGTAAMFFGDKILDFSVE